MATPAAMQRLLNVLHFVRIIEAGSFAEAARQAGTTTSAMSKTVTRFERAHGVRLLHRTTHAISLTLDGEKLVEGARDLLRDAEQLEAMLEQTSAASAAGCVQVSTPGPLIRACLSPHLPALLRANPAIELDLKIDDAQLDLAGEPVDTAIKLGSLDGQPGPVAKRLMTFPWVFCASPRYLAAMGEPRSPADLGAHHQIGFRDAASGQLMAWQVRDLASGTVIRHVPRNRLVVEDITTIWAMVLAGFGTARLPAWCGLADLREGRLVELLPGRRVPDTPVSAVQLDRSFTPRRTRGILDSLVDAARGWRYEAAHS